MKKQGFNKYPTKQIKICTKKQIGTTLRITKKNFQDKELLLELFLTTRQKTKMRNAFAKTKMRNAFANNMLTDIKLSKA